MNATTSYATELRCREGEETFALEEIGAPACAAGDFPEVRYDLARARRELDRDAIGQRATSLWRYSALLPVRDPGAAVSLGEGWTPLLPASRLGEALGCSRLLVKDEGRNPSGTFKDRGASVAVSRLRELGIDTVVHASSGNAAAAWGLYAARAGMRCVNVLPDDVLPASLQQSVLAGAETYVLDAPWQSSGAVAAEAAERNGWLHVGTLKEPYRLEGKKTMGYELAEQLGWRLPHAVVYPTGGGLGAIAIYKAFAELLALGWVAPGPLPKLVVAQYEGCAPIVEAYRTGARSARPWTALDVPPGGLKSTRPPGDRAVLRLIRETRGTAAAVSTAEALAAAAEMTRLEGVFPCPESATTVAALRTALARGVVAANEHIVLMVTGTGLKSVPLMPEAHAARIASAQEIGARGLETS